jgi:hypothetical protein
MPKPATEERHARHILRFYVARALAKSGYEPVVILPNVKINAHELEVDVAGEKDGKLALAICEPAGVTQETVDKLDLLRDADETEVIILYSQFASPGEVPERFEEQIASRKFRLMSIVPPPFDDVLEYDIWMFELTFQEQMA